MSYITGVESACSAQVSSHVNRDVTYRQLTGLATIVKSIPKRRCHVYLATFSFQM